MSCSTTATKPAEAPLIVSVGDREVDIDELLAEAQQYREQGLGLLVRSPHNRSLEGGEAQMWQHLEQSEQLGTHTLQLPRSQGQKARQATLSVRYTTVIIAVPVNKARHVKKDTPVEVCIVELRVPLLTTSRLLDNPPLKTSAQTRLPSAGAGGRARPFRGRRCRF